MRKVFSKGTSSNIRIKTDVNSDVIGVISKSIGAIFYKYTDKINGYRWIQLQSGGYVREDVTEVFINGYSYPDEPIKNISVMFTGEMTREYLPVLNSISENKGVKLLAAIMAHKEGFKKGTRSYRTNNPGNIGNTDSGANSVMNNLNDGIMAQINYIKRVANGTHSAYKFGNKIIKPFYSEEIAKNQITYGGKSPYLPGYNFDFKGELGAFVKIYSTGARNGNSYLSMIISYFKQNGITITEHTLLSEICNIK